MNQGLYIRYQGEVRFLDWISLYGTHLTEDAVLYFGDPAVISTVVGRRYLMSAYRFVIDTFNSGVCWKGGFTVHNFLAVAGLFRMNIKAIHHAAGFNDLLVDLRALSNLLLGYYRRHNVAALYTDHLNYFISSPPPAVHNSVVFQHRFIVLIAYHYSFSSTSALRALFSSLAKSKDYLGYNDVLLLNNLLQDAWNDLDMHKSLVGKNWCNEAKKNPVFYEVIMFRNNQTGVATHRYTPTPRSLYTLGRNSEVHAPEKTKGPSLAPLDMITAAPNGAGHWQWEFDHAQVLWLWQWKPAHGVWHWPTVPADGQWRKQWPTAAPPAPSPAQAAAWVQSNPEQKMVSHDQSGLMLGKMYPGTGEYDKFFSKGTYGCAGCGTPLYKSSTKFNSGCGWPAFYEGFPGAIKRTADPDGRRVEITCAACGGHLGNVFKGERFNTPTDERHCVNSTSLKFVPASEEEAS